MKYLNIQDVTPALMVKNEEFWIHYVLRDILSFYGRAVMLDTGSSDSTINIAAKTGIMTGADLTIIRENYGDDPNKIGNGRNVLREAVKTYWMFLVDGDEIWTMPFLNNLHKIAIPEHTIEVGMVGGYNVADVNGELMLRDMASYDRIFNPDVSWKTTEYPFESHNLEDRLKREKVYYFDHNLVHHWHVRHTRRSILNDHAYFRERKIGFYPWKHEYLPMPTDWLKIKTKTAWPYNPYFEGM